MADRKKDNDREIAYSAPDLWGGITHFNSRGEQVGYSMPDKLGGMVNFDATGKEIGYSAPDIFGGSTHFDEKGRMIGYAIKIEPLRSSSGTLKRLLLNFALQI